MGVAERKRCWAASYANYKQQSIRSLSADYTDYADSGYEIMV